MFVEFIDWRGVVNLDKFVITKLNGYQNVEINIRDNRKILVAENGSGKTTILNILYCCLTNNTNKLKNFIFEKAELFFSNGNTTIFYKDDLEQKYNENFDDVWSSYSRLKPSDYFLLNDKLNSIFHSAGLVFEYSGYIDAERFVRNYVNFIFETDGRSEFFKKRYISKYFLDNLKLNTAKMFIDVEDLVMEKEYLYKAYFYLKSGEFSNYSGKRKFNAFGEVNRKNSFSREISNFILSELEWRITEIKNLKRSKFYNAKVNTIFLPTYRRIENDSTEILEDFKVKEDSHISFGIKDVVALYSDIFKNLKGYSFDAFAKINNNIIDKYLSGNLIFDESKLAEYNREELELVLNRIGNGIDKRSKEKILNLVDNNCHNDYISLLLINMINIYEKQKKVEGEIVKYTTVCNKYLVGKSIEYCPEKMQIQLFQNGKELNFNVFSSGEKQIVSLFAKLYLLPLKDLDWSNENKLLENLTNKKFWIIFDEPELSLSVEWQKSLLPDILDSNRCDFLFVTTHSPFIFKNDLKFFTSDIRNYVSEF